MKNKTELHRVPYHGMMPVKIDKEADTEGCLWYNRQPGLYHIGAEGCSTCSNRLISSFEKRECPYIHLIHKDIEDDGEIALDKKLKDPDTVDLLKSILDLLNQLIIKIDERRKEV